MANKNILTYNSKVAFVEQQYYAPVAYISGGQSISTIYCALCRVDPWLNEDSPEQPTQDQQYIKKVFNNIFVAKQITSSQISPVIPRVDWTSGTTYDYYQDGTDILAKDNTGNKLYKFYVRNNYDQVFKCLWNNNGQPSTVEPVLQPGNFSQSNIFQSSGTNADGYKWKYMYTIDTGSRVKFLDFDWMPVPIGANTPNPNPIQTNAGFGDIEVINVTNGGLGYNVSNTTVNIVGDGLGASGYIVANSNGSITDIVVTSSGANYSYANVTFTTTSGSGAVAISPASPIGGHGFDPVSELGCNHVMFTCEFNGTEGGNIPTDVNFRQLALIVNPTATDTFPYPANNSIYPVYTQVIVAPGAGGFYSDDYVYQGSSTSPTFTGTVLSWDSSNNYIKLINTVGTLSNNSPIFDSLGTARTVLSYTNPKFQKFSGYLAYIENRTGVQRSPDGIEQLKFVLGY